MRIVAGAWRGRQLTAPPGNITRPTADRVRQALFDTLLHAAWGGRSVIEGVSVLDVFAGTGASGLEALSRGAGFARFLEQDAAALKALRANIAACGARQVCEVVAGDLLRLPAAGKMLSRAGPTDGPASLVFLDPPYGRELVPAALKILGERGFIAPDALVVAELGRDEDWNPDVPILDRRGHGAAQWLVFRNGLNRSDG
jgi:16S rRNA (guanine966-N2)-methyltransferase